MASRNISVGVCYGMAEALMIQAVLKARGIEAFIPGLGSGALAYTSGFTSEILVDAELAEEAASLIAELRTEQASSGDEEGEGDGEGDGEGEGGADGEDSVSTRVARAKDEELATPSRRWRAATIIVSLSLTFGMGHLLNRAWGRGMMLAGLEVLGIRYLVMAQEPHVGAGLILTAVVLDVIGGFMLARRGRPGTPRIAMPEARLHR
jgi:hypothetical protein